MGSLFLVGIVHSKESDTKVVTVENSNFTKRSDSFVSLYNEQEKKIEEENAKKEQELIELEEQKKKEAEEKAKKEAEEKAALEAAKAKEEAERQKAIEEEEKRNAVVINANGYMSKPDAGFDVTTDNKAYSLTDDEFNVVSGVVACEAVSKDDALAVISVILNRADARNLTPVQVVAQPNQFTCYYKQGNPNKYATVVRDALSGIRNNNYHSFNGWWSSSPNYIVEGGNRFY